MYVSVNKKNGVRRPVKYSALNSALSAATSSGVWVDDDTSALTAEKRTNRIKLTRKTVDMSAYDA